MPGSLAGAVERDMESTSCSGCFASVPCCHEHNVHGILLEEVQDSFVLEEAAHASFGPVLNEGSL